MGVPTDIYKYGVTYGCATITLLLAMVLSYLYCLPVFYALQVTSTYEYLEKRFDSSVRSIVSALFTLSMFLYLPIVIYLPALALSQGIYLTNYWKSLLLLLIYSNQFQCSWYNAHTLRSLCILYNSRWLKSCSVDWRDSVHCNDSNNRCNSIFSAIGCRWLITYFAKE